jgi:two-component system phosphate regulon sensor histidine kinase PhoR
VVSLGIGLVLAVGLWAWLTRRVTTPLSRLARVAKAYAEGDLTLNAPTASVREIRELAEALNIMAQTIRNRLDELTTERNQATAILESLAEGVIAVDPQGRIVLANPAAHALLGLTAQPLRDKSLFEAVRHRGIRELGHTVLRDHQRLTKDITLFQPDERLLRVHGVPCQGCEPTGPCAVLVIQDVTEHNRNEQLRKEFVANVSHELKSPLTSIQGLTETLLGGAVHDPTSNHRFVQLIAEDTSRLSRLIDDLLSLSQIESRASPLKLDAVELKPLVESVVASLQRGIEQRRLTVNLAIPSGLAARADAGRMRQVFVNLIDNAIKYNKEGGAMTVSAAQEHARVVITVADTGIGIPEQDLPRVFERFYRVDKTRSRELGGTGLGLSIVKHIVESLGGIVSVTSELGRGSAFSFTLPLRS